MSEKDKVMSEKKNPLIESEGSKLTELDVIQIVCDYLEPFSKSEQSRILVYVTDKLTGDFVRYWSSKETDS